MFALESAMDELAVACGLDPIELRMRNEPAVEPEDDRPFSSRGLVGLPARRGARFRLGRRAAPSLARAAAGAGSSVTGVASSTYPVYHLPNNGARVA